MLSKIEKFKQNIVFLFFCHQENRLHRRMSIILKIKKKNRKEISLKLFLYIFICYFINKNETFNEGGFIEKHLQ